MVEFKIYFKSRAIFFLSIILLISFMSCTELANFSMPNQNNNVLKITHDFYPPSLVMSKEEQNINLKIDYVNSPEKILISNSYIEGLNITPAFKNSNDFINERVMNQFNFAFLITATDSFDTNLFFYIYSLLVSKASFIYHVGKTSVKSIVFPQINSTFKILSITQSYIRKSHKLIFMIMLQNTGDGQIFSPKYFDGYYNLEYLSKPLSIDSNDYNILNATIFINDHYVQCEVGDMIDNKIRIKCNTSETNLNVDKSATLILKYGYLLSYPYHVYNQ